MKDCSKKQQEIETQPMINEPGVLQVVAEDLDLFVKRHGFKSIKEIECEKCGRKLKTTLASYCSGYACLEAPICECGEKSQIIFFQPASKKEKVFWDETYKSFESMF